VLYNNTATAPSAIGTYEVTFNVVAASGWKAADGLAGGILVIENSGTKSTPVAADYRFNGQVQTFDGKAKRLGIVPINSTKSNGRITIFYNNSADEPTAIGVYTVTFNVEATDLWNAATGLAADPMQIVLDEGATVTPVKDDFDITGIGTYTVDLDSPRWVYVDAKAGKTKGNVSVTYNGSENQPKDIGTYDVWFDVTASPPWGEAHIYAGQVIITEGKEVKLDMFDVSGLKQAYDGNPKAVKVKAKVDHQALYANVKYAPSGGGVAVSTPPYQIGTYDVTIDVPKVPGYQPTSESIPVGTLTIGASTGSTVPTVANFKITGTGTFVFDASKPKIVSVEPSTEEYSGQITVRYTKRGSGSVDKPVDVGTYDVYFDVTPSINYGAANNLSAGELTIYKVNPYYLQDYIVEGGPFRYNGLAQRVEISSPTLGSGLVISSVLYTGSSIPPTAVGDYEVTFNLAESDNWQAASGISAGTMSIHKGYPNLKDYTITLPAGKEYNGTAITGASAAPVDGYAVSDGARTFTYNGSATPPVDAGVYEVLLSIAGNNNWEPMPGLEAGKVEITARTPVESDFLPGGGGLVQEAYSVTAVTFRADASRSPAYPGTLSNNAVTYLPYRNIAALNQAGYGVYTVTVNVPANSPNWKAAALKYDLNVGELVFDAPTKFRDWLNSKPNGSYNVKFFPTTAIIANTDIKIITDALKDTTTGQGHANNSAKYINIDLSKGIAQAATLALTGANGFGSCTTLTGLDLSGLAVTYDGTTLSGCTRLAELKLPLGTVTSLPTGTFQTLSALKTLDTGGLLSLTAAQITLDPVAPATTSGKIPLENVTLSAAGTWSAETFQGTVSGTTITANRALKTLTVLGGSIPANAFQHCTALTTVTFTQDSTTGYGANTIGANAFDGCTNLATVTFPKKWDGPAADTVAIGANAFKGCGKLEVVDIPYLVNNSGPNTFTISDTAFYDSGLKTLSLGGTADSIGTGVNVLIAGVFKNQRKLETVALKTGVVSVPNSAFEGCISLKEVSFATTVTSIGESAFEGCAKLTSVDLKGVIASATAIGKRAFRGCSTLSSVTFPASVYTTIAAGTFMGTALRSITLPTVTIINGAVITDGVGDGGAFENCTSLESVKYEGALATIQTMAFAGCIKLKDFSADPTADANKGKVVIPATVVGATNPAANAFKGCTSIETVKIIAAATGAYLGQSFAGCTGLKTLEVQGAAAPDSMNFGAGDNAVPSITKIIWDTATFGIVAATPAISFVGCTGLERLVVSQNLAAAIGNNLFPRNASSFKTLEIQAAQSVVAAATFTALPNTVTNVIVGETTANPTVGFAVAGTAAIFNPKVNNVEFKGESVGGLGVLLLGGLGEETDGGPITVSISGTPATQLAIATYKIGTVKVGPKVGTIATGTTPSFNYATLKEFVVDPANEKYGNNGSDGVLYEKNSSGAIAKLLQYPANKAAATFSVPSGVTEIGPSAFGTVANPALNIKTLTIPASVDTIGADAYLNITNTPTTGSGAYPLVINYEAVDATCSSTFPLTLKNLNIGGGVKAIPATFLGANTQLDTLTIPSSVTSIGDSAFNTTGVVYKSVNFNAAGNYVGNEIFKDVTSIVSVTFGNSVSVIRSDMFNGAAGITYVSLSEGLTTIEAGAFSGCTLLNRIAIPASCISIGYHAFTGATKMTEVIFRGTITGFTEDAGFIAAGSAGESLLDKYREKGVGRYTQIPGGTPASDASWYYVNNSTSFDGE
jgi:hypothetical protein